MLTLDVWNGLEDRRSSGECTLFAGIRRRDIAREDAVRYLAEKDPLPDKGHCILYSVTEHDPDLDIITRISVFRKTVVTEAEVFDLDRRFPFADFGVIYPGQKTACRRFLKKQQSREIRPVTFREANRFLEQHHRHHGSVAGGKFAIGLYELGTLIGVACCGRPVSRVLDDGLTLEINRLCCLNSEKNTCSMLYGRSCLVAKDMGYRKVITYILESETGSSLRAAGFTLEARNVGGKAWTGRRSKKCREKASVKKRPPRQQDRR